MYETHVRCVRLGRSDYRRRHTVLDAPASSLVYSLNYYSYFINVWICVKHAYLFKSLNTAWEYKLVVLLLAGLYIHARFRCLHYILSVV